MKRPVEDTEPPVAVHVTAVLLEPVTVALNCCVAPVTRELVEGEIETATAGAAVTVTLALELTVESDVLVAVTV